MIADFSAVKLIAARVSACTRYLGSCRGITQCSSSCEALFEFDSVEGAHNLMDVHEECANSFERVVAVNQGMKNASEFQSVLLFNHHHKQRR